MATSTSSPSTTAWLAGRTGAQQAFLLLRTIFTVASIAFGRPTHS